MDERSPLESPEQLFDRHRQFVAEAERDIPNKRLECAVHAIVHPTGDSEDDLTVTHMVGGDPRLVARIVMDMIDYLMQTDDSFKAAFLTENLNRLRGLKAKRDAEKAAESSGLQQMAKIDGLDALGANVSEETQELLKQFTLTTKPDKGALH